MARVFDVASFFVDFGNQSEENDISNMKLNKLLYFAQGVYLARNDRTLFSDDIKAWEMGPVIKKVYIKYKECKSKPIFSKKNHSYNCLTSIELQTLYDVAREYGRCSAYCLSDLTHACGSPWCVAIGNNEETISQDEIKRFFKEHNKIKSFSEFVRNNDWEFIGIRDKDGVLVLPPEDPGEDWSEYDNM